MQTRFFPNAACKKTIKNALGSLDVIKLLFKPYFSVDSSHTIIPVLFRVPQHHLFILYAVIMHFSRTLSIMDFLRGTLYENVDLEKAPKQTLVS